MTPTTIHARDLTPGMHLHTLTWAGPRIVTVGIANRNVHVTTINGGHRVFGIAERVTVVTSHPHPLGDTLA